MTPVILWTRDAGARQTIPLVLSRIGQPFVRCRSVETVVAEMTDLGSAMLVLGPSFDEPEAHRVQSALIEKSDCTVTVVLLEDVLAPLSPRLVLAQDAVRLRLPVRPRTLREVVEAWRASAD
jgi:hypothetical protein